MSSSSYPKLGKYQIIEEIGRGGMGTVYKGYDPSLDRTVAIKLLAPNLAQEPSFLERFIREARSAGRLQHPNIIPVHDVGQDGANYYFVMAFLPGPSLKHVIMQKGRFGPAEALPILRQLSDALDYAHSKGLIHRDVKPANVMFDERGQTVLTDFGIVRAAQDSRLTATGVSIGTPEYMAPEQVLSKEVDARTDQYALGIIAFEMLTGCVPFDGDSTAEILYKQVSEGASSVTSRYPHLSPAVQVVLNRVLSKSPADRYASCKEFVETLERALGLPAAQPRQPWTQPGLGSSDRTRLYDEPLIVPRQQWQPAARPPTPPPPAYAGPVPLQQPQPPARIPARTAMNLLPLLLVGVCVVSLVLVGLIALAIARSRGSLGLTTPTPTATLTGILAPVPTSTNTPTLTDTPAPTGTSEPTVTQSPVPTATASPRPTNTNTPVPTRTRVPPTPTPRPPSVTPTSSGNAINFWADRYTINNGECVNIYWQVEHVKAVFYKGQGVSGNGSAKECPTSTTTYELAVQRLDGQWEPRQVKITVK